MPWQPPYVQPDCVQHLASVSPLKVFCDTPCARCKASFRCLLLWGTQNERLELVGQQIAWGTNITFNVIAVSIRICSLSEAVQLSDMSSRAMLKSGAQGSVLGKMKIDITMQPRNQQQLCTSSPAMCLCMGLRPATLFLLSHVFRLNFLSVVLPIFTHGAETQNSKLRMLRLHTVCQRRWGQEQKQKSRSFSTMKTKWTKKRTICDDVCWATPLDTVAMTGLQRVAFTT